MRFSAKTNYWPVGFLVVLGSLALPWFDPVMTPRFSALNFPLAHSAYLWPSHLNLFSYGMVALLLVAAGVFFWWRNRGLAVLSIGGLLLFLAMTFYLQITCWEPSWLRAALIGGQDFEHCYRFEVAYTLPNAVISSPAKGLFEPVEGVSARFFAATSALGVGWSFFIAGAIWVCGAGLAQMENWRRLKIFLPVMIVVFALFGFLQIWRPIAAQRALAAAEIAAAHGDFVDAEKDVDHAMNLDAWYRLTQDAYVRLGQLYAAMGYHDRPEIYLAKAADLQARGLVPEALFAYTRAANTDDAPLKRVALEEKARLASHYAGALYGKGSIGEAAHYWDISIAADPRLVDGYFGAGRANYDVADYPAAIKYLEPLLNKTSQFNVLSDAASYLGDCYYRMGQVEKARKWYMASRDYDDRANFRALKTLTESYYK
ncbi:MAG: tetratricopeptide repeat protein [Chthoniobacterales bacterium]